MGSVISIISGKGGVGKTTTALNLGVLLAKSKESVIVVEGNLTTPNLGLHLGNSSVPTHLNDVLNFNNKFHDAIYSHPSGMKLMLASIKLEDTININLNAFPGIIRDLKKFYDIIIIDGAAGLGRESLNTINVCDYAIVVCTPNIIAVTEAFKAIKLCKIKNKKVLGVIITRKQKSYDEMSVDQISEILKVNILGIIPEDINVRKSIDIKQPVTYNFPSSKSSKNYALVAEILLGKSAAKNLNNDKKSLFYYVLKSLGLKK